MHLIRLPVSGRIVNLAHVVESERFPKKGDVGKVHVTCINNIGFTVRDRDAQYLHDALAAACQQDESQILPLEKVREVS